MSDAKDHRLDARGSPVEDHIYLREQRAGNDGSKVECAYCHGFFSPGRGGKVPSHMLEAYVTCFGANRAPVGKETGTCAKGHVNVPLTTSGRIAGHFRTHSAHHHEWQNSCGEFMTRPSANPAGVDR